jgi:hypothetical protein
LHHEVYHEKELLELPELVGLFGGLVDVKPTFANAGKLLLNDLDETADPPCFSRCMLKLGNIGALVLLEAINSMNFASTFIGREDPMGLHD